MRYLAVAALAMLFASTASSQGRFGIKAGIVLNYINTRGSGGDIYSDLSIGHTFGASYTMPTSNNFAVQPEFNFVSLKSDEAIGNSTAKFGYVQIPVLLKGITNKQAFSVYIGPQLSFLTDASRKASGGAKTDITKQVTETLFDGVMGIEYITPIKISINARYTHSFSNVFKSEFEGFKSRHQYATVTLGYQFGKRKPVAP
ncbi:MAG TPA: porin family protein [Chitinophagaceae bacterium]|nr:porin family protein [Chitinophagaceae bacterium]